MSYVANIETQADIKNIECLLDKGYTLKPMVGHKTPVLKKGLVVDVVGNSIFVGKPQYLLDLGKNVPVSTSELLRKLDITKE